MAHSAIHVRRLDQTTIRVAGASAGKKLIRVPWAMASPSRTAGSSRCEMPVGPEKADICGTASGS
jgi:hypothetical protein